MPRVSRIFCLHYSKMALIKPFFTPTPVCWMDEIEKCSTLFSVSKIQSQTSAHYCPNVSTTPITAMGCRQCLPLSVVQLKGKHCWKPHCRNGVVDTFGHSLLVTDWSNLFLHSKIAELVAIKGNCSETHSEMIQEEKLKQQAILTNWRIFGLLDSK